MANFLCQTLFLDEYNPGEYNYHDSGQAHLKEETGHWGLLNPLFQRKVQPFLR